MIKLILGDCLEKMKEVDDKSIDMILCDLPYGTTACKWDVVIPFEQLWVQYKRIIKDKGCIALFGSEPFLSYLRMSNIKMYKYDWIWKKNAGSNFALVKFMPMKEHEIISIFCKSSTYYYPIKQERTESGRNRVKSRIIYNNDSDHSYISNKKVTVNLLPELRYPSSVQVFSRERGLHPTQKPVALLEYLIKTYTLEGQIVLDNCMGSGSTGVACLNTKRNFIGIEKEKKYYDISVKRIKESGGIIDIL